MATEHRTSLLLLSAMAVALAPHLPRLPLWIILWCGIFWSWAGLAVFGHLPWPRRLVRNALAVAGFIAAFGTFGFSFNRDAGAALLVVMVGLKPLEIRTYRDRMMTVFLTYFLILTHLLYSNALTMLVYMVVAVAAVSTVLVHLHHPHGRIGDHARQAVRILLHAAPLAIVFFLVFPRLQGSLWSLSAGTTGVTGFSERMAPGTIAELTRSNAVAFRATFPNDTPPADTLYWRGLVFADFDGTEWGIGDAVPMGLPPIVGNRPTVTTIMLEPHQRRWLFALDLPSQIPPSVAAFGDFTLQWPTAVKEPIRYRVTSVTAYATGDLSRRERRQQTHPVAGNPRTRRLAEQWRRQAERPRDIVQAALSFFRNGGFTYTLNPPLLGPDPIDAFLFDTKRGYCEHFASAMAVLMRSAGLPARVVGGYLGGERNPLGDYWIIRQSDAHAWTEIWLPESGWTRVDPTLVVAPERIVAGAAAALPEEERGLTLPLRYAGPGAGLIRNLLLGWDAANALWQRQVIGYTFQRQRQLLSRLGIRAGTTGGRLRMVLLGAAATVLVAGLYAVRIRRRKEAPEDRVAAAYRAFCRKLARCRIPKEPQQGPLDYLKTIRDRRADLAESAKAIIALYIRLRYTDRGTDADLRELRRRVRAFRPALPPGSV